jgi:hypothetical protein
MESNAVEPDVPISHEQSADYWRERAECLEEWVCELLRKNQTLRMEHLQRQHREEAPLAFSLLGLYQSRFPSGPLAFRVESPKRAFDTGTGSCPRKECTEIRSSVLRGAVMNESVPEVSN